MTAVDLDDGLAIDEPQEVRPIRKSRRDLPWWELLSFQPVILGGPMRTAPEGPGWIEAHRRRLRRATHWITGRGEPLEDRTLAYIVASSPTVKMRPSALAAHLGLTAAEAQAEVERLVEAGLLATGSTVTELSWCGPAVVDRLLGQGAT